MRAYLPLCSAFLTFVNSVFISRLL